MQTIIQKSKYMQENYITGDFNAPQQQTNKNNTHLTHEQPANPSLNEQSQYPKQKQSNQQPQQKFVDVEEVIVEPEEYQDQKFIQSNPDVAIEQKTMGNSKYQSKSYSQALEFYKKSLQYTAKQSEQDKKFRSVIYSNIGLTYMKMNQDQLAIQYFQNSLKNNEQYVKARTNLALCYENTEKPEQALKQFKTILQTNPNDKYIKEKALALEIKVKELQQKQKQQVMSGLKNIGNSILGYFNMSLDNFKLQKGPGGGYNVSFKQ